MLTMTRKRQEIGMEYWGNAKGKGRKAAAFRIQIDLCQYWEKCRCKKDGKKGRAFKIHVNTNYLHIIEKDYERKRKEIK